VRNCLQAACPASESISGFWVFTPENDLPAAIDNMKIMGDTRSIFFALSFIDNEFYSPKVLIVAITG
jgi:hypothetical protein